MNSSRFLVMLLAALGFGAFPTRYAFAAEEAKALFLPKNPTSAAYILGRLSNKELMEAPRSEFVYVALLQRPGLERKYRIEALDGLAKLRGTTPVAELIRGIGEVEKKGESTAPVLRELSALLIQTSRAELAAQREDLQKLAAGAQSPLGRQIGHAAMITADGTAELTWSQAQEDAPKLADVVASVPLLRDETLRATLYSRIEPLLHREDSPDLRRAAITAVSAIPGHEAETFNALASLLKAGTERTSTIASLQRVPRKSWPRDQASPLLEGLLEYLSNVPIEQRTEPDVADAFQFATDLASLLPSDEAAAVNRSLRAMGVSVFVLRTIREQMLYDKSLLVVEAGKLVEILLVNEDVMPHNLVIVTPGAAEEVGKAAERMTIEPDAEGRTHVPQSPLVLHATRMVDPGQQAKLSFMAPDDPGEYQYVCTFPGHWMRMLGTLAVVKDVEAYLASRAAEPQPTVTEWKLEDLAPDLPTLAPGRNLAGARETFAKLACVQCHKLRGEGYAYGPDLTDVFKRWNNDRAAVLGEILDPSKVIAERYRNHLFELKDGDERFGMIVNEDAESVTLQTGPSDALIFQLKKSDIRSRDPQSSSMMPTGLVSTLTKEQILDLIAYMEFGANAAAHEHPH